MKKKDELQEIYDMMPKGWREAAKESGALRRSRNIQNPEELLRLNLLYQTMGGSYGTTAIFTQLSGDQIGLSKTAVQKRIVNSGPWLQWNCRKYAKKNTLSFKNQNGWMNTEYA